MWVGTTVTLALLFLGVGFALRFVGKGNWVLPPAFWIYPASMVSVCVVAALHRVEGKMLENLPRRSQGDIPGVEIRSARHGRLLRSFAEQSLCGLSLRGINLEGACLWGEDLSGVDLSEARLEFAVLRAAILDEANLRHADLRNVILEGARLHRADLRGANLRGANLTKADLQGAIYDRTTRWPTDFRPDEAGCVRLVGVSSDLPIPAPMEPGSARELPVPSATSRARASEREVQPGNELTEARLR